MAALVVRSDDPSSSLLLQGGGGRGGAAGAGGGGGGGGSRSRKSKNGPKKQPQRGLGVAQLEKLRLQEESKHESACLASLGLLPLLPLAAASNSCSSSSSSLYGGFEDGHGGELCFPAFVHGGGGGGGGAAGGHHHHHHIKGIVGFAAGSGYRGNGLATPYSPNGGFASSSRGFDDHHHFSSATTATSPLAILFQQHQQQQQQKLAAIHTNGNGSPTPTSCSSKPMAVLPPLPVPEKTTKVFIGGGGGSGGGGGGGSGGVVMRATCIEDLQQKNGGGGGGGGGGGEHHFGVNCVQLFDPGSLPMPMPMPPRDSSRELSMVGIPVPKELSSFQTNFPGNPVWSTTTGMRNASSPPAEKRPCLVAISLDHGEIHRKPSQGETTDGIILKGGAHYTPRSISNALGKSSLPFLKADATAAPTAAAATSPVAAAASIIPFDNVAVVNKGKGQGKGDYLSDSASSVSSIPFLRKRVAAAAGFAACYLDDDSASCPAAKKALVSSGADFLALSLSISHSDVVVEPGAGTRLTRSARCGDDDDDEQQQQQQQQQQQRSSLSLQETVTDVEDGSSSQKSPSSYGNSSTDVSTIEVEHSIAALPHQDHMHNRHHHHHHHHQQQHDDRRRRSSSDSTGSRDVVDLNLKLAI